MNRDVEEARLQLMQDGRLYPLGRLLRSTFDADHPPTPDRAVAGLMIDLAKVPFDPSTSMIRADSRRVRSRRSLLVQLIAATGRRTRYAQSS